MNDDIIEIKKDLKMIKQLLLLFVNDHIELENELDKELDKKYDKWIGEIK
jgi:hypothetical protein